MKLINKISFIVFLLFFSSLTYGWSIDITSPTGGSNCPGRYYYQSSGTFNVTFSLNGISDTYDYQVHLKKDGVTFHSSNWGATSSSNPVTVQFAYSNLCYNNNMEIQVYAQKQSGTGDNQSSNVFVIVYTNLDYTQCTSSNKGLVNGNVTLLNDYQMGNFYRGWPCGIANGYYAFRRYKVEWTVTGNFTNSTISVNKDLSLGYSAAMANYQYPWAFVDNITSTTAHFYTFVYELKASMNGSYIGYYPCTPSNAAVVYTITQNQPPIISGFTQTPQIIYPGQTGTITCNLSQGNCCGVDYDWDYAHKPSFMSVSFSGNTATITNNYSVLDGENSGIIDLVERFRVSCTATNSYGSDEKEKLVFWSQNAGGCPWIFVQTDEFGFTEENNILHRSEFPENLDEDITDVYKINSVPYTENGEIKIQILESGRKYNYFDQVKLFYVDHPEGTQLGVTENNQMVLYTINNVISTDTANFNDTTGITQMIQYPFVLEVDPLDGDTLDHAYVHFPTNNSLNTALITLLDYDKDIIIHKYPVADVLFNTSVGSYQTSFAMRELENETIVPITPLSFSGFSVYDANLTYMRHFNTKYIALAVLSAVSSYTEVALTSAELSGVGDITQFVQDVDQEYGEMDSLSSIMLTFNSDEIPAVSKGYVRDFVFKSVGRYISTNPYESSDSYYLINKSESTSFENNPVQYRLYSNYPNPFNPATQIRYDLKSSGIVKIGIYNVLGQLVKELINEFKDAGNYSIMFDGTSFASGIYFYKMESGDFVDSKKMVLIK